jgi:tetratricopeptide (TPR) repeat protein
MTLDDMLDAADGRTLNEAGNAFADRGMWNEAVACYERALERYRRAGDRRGEALALNNLGAASYGMGDWDAALGWYQEALAILRGSNDREACLFALMNVCFLLFAQGGAGAELDEAQRLAEEMGKDNPLAKICWMRGDAAFREGRDLVKAFGYYAQACLHASRASSELLDQTLGYVAEHLRVLVDNQQSLAALAFCDHLRAFGREQKLGEVFDAKISHICSSIISPPLLGG